MKKIGLLFLFTLMMQGLSSYAQNGLNFDGVNDVVITNQNAITGNTTRTVEAWIKMPTTVPTTQMVVVDMGNTTPNGSRFTLCILNQNLRVEIGGNGFTSTATNLADNAWHHVAVTYNSANAAGTKAKLYVDGTLATQSDFTVTMNVLATSNIRIGSRVDGVSFFQGTIDEVRIWNVERTAAQIMTDKNRELCVGPSGLVAYYKFNEGTAGGTNTSITTAANTVNGAFSGTLTNFTLTGATSNFVTGVTLAIPTIVSKKDSFNCGAGKVTLEAITATGGNLKWYAAAVGGVNIGNGNTFVTPSINTTTNYFVEAVQLSSVGQLGRNDYTGISQVAPNMTGQGIQFNALTNINLDSVSVWVVDNTGSIIVQLQNAANTILRTDTFAFSTTGATATNRVKIYLPVNYTIPTGNNYKLLALAGTSVSLSREQAINPPFATYTIANVVSMTSSWVNGALNNANYYYFYNFYLSSGCTSPRQQVTATIRPIPAVNLGNDTTICPGISYTFNAGNAGATYLWTPGGQTTQTITTNAAGQYIVNVMANGCARKDTIIVTPGIAPVNNLSDSVNLCDGSTITLNAGNTGSSFTWTPGGATTQTIDVNSGGTKSVVIKSIHGCKITSSTYIKMRPLPVDSLGNDTAICSTVSLQLNAGNAGYGYAWNTGATSQTINSSDSGTYTVTVTSPYNCVNKDSIHIAYLPEPRTQGFNFIPKFYEELGKVEFSPLNPTNVNSYEWNFGDGSAIVTAMNPTHVYTASGEYEVTLKVYNSCSDYTVKQTIHVDLPTGIVTLNNTDVQLLIYPNPAKSVLNISNKNADYAMKDIMVFNAVGSMVYHQKAESGIVHQLSVEGFASGVYFIRVLTDKGFVNKQIQVVK